MGKSTMNITVYAEDLFYECFPRKSESDYEAMLAFDVEKLVEEQERERGVKVGAVRLVAIDEEYRAWIKKSKAKNTSESRFLYMAGLSDEQVKRLWEKNGFSRYPASCAVPFLMAGDSPLPNANLPFGEKSERKIKTILSRALGVEEADVLVHPEIMLTDYYQFQFLPYFEDAACAFFGLEDVEPQKPPAHLRPQGRATADMRVVPIVVRVWEKCLLRPADWRKRGILEKPVPERALADWGIEAVGALADVSAMIPGPYIIAGDRALEERQALIEAMEEENSRRSEK